MSEDTLGRLGDGVLDGARTRAEVAISYLLHLWANEQGRTVRPLSTEELFERAAGVTAAWAGAVTKPGFVKFAWQPGHDD